MSLVFPPPDGEMSLPTSGEYHRHPPMHSWRYGLHGRPHTAAALPSYVVQHVNPCWRPPVCDGDRSPATSRWLRQCVGTAGPGIVDLSAIHRSGTDGLDATCRGVEAPS